MSPATPIDAAPSTLLLATDLGARGDRALARALQLARQWNARLLVATVLPEASTSAGLLPVAEPDDAAARQLAGRRLQRMLEDEAAAVLLDVRILRGHVGAALLQLAIEENCGLIVTGVASDPLCEVPLLGSTVQWLTRHSTLPVLIVHERVHGPYRKLAVATDFSDGPAHATVQALSLFGPPLQFALVHGLESPGSLLPAADRNALEQELRAAAQQQVQATLGALRPLLGQAQLHASIEPGDPAQVLRQQALASNSDLVVVATHGRGALFELVIGSVARRLVATLETDTLLVRDPRSLAAAVATPEPAD